MNHRSQRGSTLIMSVVVMLVVTIIGVAVIRFSTLEAAGASAGARRRALVACAEAGRRLVTAQFHAVGLAPTALKALNIPLDGTASNSRTLAVGGHVDQDPAKASTQDATKTEVQVSQVVFLPDNSFGPSNRVRDLTNVVSLFGQGGKPIKVVVHCVDNGTSGDPTSGRQLEVEFGVRFGL